MKNAAEWREFLDDPKNWEIVEKMRNVRLSRITYKNEHRYKLETFEVVSMFDYHDRKPYSAGEWRLRTYYKKPDNPDEIITNAGDKADLLEPQSVTDLREWLNKLDRKGGAE